MKENSLEQALQKWEHDLKLAQTPEEKGLIFWDIAFGWSVLAENTLEIHDIAKAIHFFEQAEHMGLSDVDFTLDYGDALMTFALLSCKKEFLDAAISKFKKGIVDCHAREKTHSKRGWSLYLKAFKLKVEETGMGLDEIDPLFTEMIATFPQDQTLWLEWGEIYLQQGWLKKDVSLIEKALETLASYHDHSLFGACVMALGLFIDEHRLIFAGEKKIKQKEPSLFTLALSSLIKGVYFSEVPYLEFAIRCVKKALPFEKNSIYLWHILFEANLALSVIKKERRIFKRAISVMDHLLELHPESATLHFEAGLLYIQWGEKEVQGLKKSVSHFRKALSMKKEKEGKWLFYYGLALDILGEITKDPLYFEEAIDALLPYAEHLNISYRLAFLFSHLGKITKNQKMLLQASDLFELVVKKKDEDDLLFLEWGTSLTNLVQLVHDVRCPEMTAYYRFKAEEKLMHALKLGNPLANYQLARVYAYSGRDELAGKFLQRAKKTKTLPKVVEEVLGI